MKLKLLCYALCLSGLTIAPALQAQEVLPEYTQARRFAPSNAEQWLFSYTVTPHYFHNSSKVWYDYKTSDGTRWYVVEPDTERHAAYAPYNEMYRELYARTKDIMHRLG